FLNHSTGPIHACFNQLRARYSRFPAKLQRKDTQSARRLPRKRSGKKKRSAKGVNHCLSRAIVRRAQGTSRGIALEDLKGLRERATKARAGQTVAKRSASGVCCTVGRSFTSGPSSPTRRRWRGCRWPASIQPIPARSVPVVGTVADEAEVSSDVP